MLAMLSLPYTGYAHAILCWCFILAYSDSNNRRTESSVDSETQSAGSGDARKRRSLASFSRARAGMAVVLGEDATLHLGIHAPEARCEALIIISLRNAELDIEAGAMSTPPCP